MKKFNSKFVYISPFTLKESENEIQDIINDYENKIKHMVDHFNKEKTKIVSNYETSTERYKLIK